MIKVIAFLTGAFLSLPLLGQAERGEDGGIWEALSDRYDANGDGRIDAAEYTRGAATFRRLDRDGDGALTDSDFGGGRRRGGIDFERMMARRVTNASDADGSGDVTAQEWKAFLDSLQADENGVVGVEHAARALQGREGSVGQERPGRQRGDSRRPGRGRGGERMIRMLDRDADGALELDDLNAIFADLDVDRSGALEAREVAGLPRRSGGGSDVPQPGDAAPDFELPYARDDTRTVRLSSFAGQRPVALVFGSYT